MNDGKNATVEGIGSIRIRTTLVQGPNRRIIARARGHELVLDVSPERGGDDAGPTPPECLAMALGGCVLNICRVLAMEKRIDLEDIRVSVNADIDPTKAFGLPTDKRAGFSKLSVRLKMTSKLNEAEKKDFLQELVRRCPLCDTIGNSTPVQIGYAK